MRLLEAINKMGDKAIKGRGVVYFMHEGFLSYYSSGGFLKKSELEGDVDMCGFEIVDRPEKPREQINTARAISEIKAGRVVDSVVTGNKYRLINGEIRSISSVLGQPHKDPACHVWSSEEILGDWLV